MRWKCELELEWKLVESEEVGDWRDADWVAALGSWFLEPVSHVYIFDSLYNLDANEEWGGSMKGCHTAGKFEIYTE